MVYQNKQQKVLYYDGIANTILYLPYTYIFYPLQFVGIQCLPIPGMAKIEVGRGRHFKQTAHQGPILA